MNNQLSRSGISQPSVIVQPLMSPQNVGFGTQVVQHGESVAFNEPTVPLR